MAGLDYQARREITLKRTEQLKERIGKLSKHDKELALEIAGLRRTSANHIGRISQQFSGTDFSEGQKKPSDWFLQEGTIPGTRVHKGLLDVFVPQEYQQSYLYMIDKLNRFPFSRGWYRRAVHTAAYGPQMHLVFELLAAYEKLFYINERLEDLIYRRLDREKLDYVLNEWNFMQNFSLIYAAEIDRGNLDVINALQDLILSENSTAYLDREMILGIFRSDNRNLHALAGKLLVAARLQEGLRQAICETMDEGTEEAFLTILDVIENQDLIRYSSVQRAVSAWIGIFHDESVERVNRKLLALMSQCLKDSRFCRQQLRTNDAAALSVALWALGFREAQDAVAAMTELVEHGTRNQKLAAAYYNQSLFDENLKMRTARKVILEYTDDLELVAAFLPAYMERLSYDIRGLLFHSYQMVQAEVVKPKKAVLTDYFRDREDAEMQYRKFWSIYEQLPKKGLVFAPCIFPWHQAELKPSDLVCQLAFTAYVLDDEEKITQMAALLTEVSSGGFERGFLVNLLLYQPANRKQKELLIQYMGNAEEATSSKAAAIVKKLPLEQADYRLMEDMLRFKRSRLRSQLLEFLEGQQDADMEACIGRLLADKKEEKRIAGLDLLLRLSRQKKRAGFYNKARLLARTVQKPSDKEKILIEEILQENILKNHLLDDENRQKENQNDKNKIDAVPIRQKTGLSVRKRGFGIYNPKAYFDIPDFDEGCDAIKACIPLSEKEIISKIKKLDELVRENRDLEYDSAFDGSRILGDSYVRLRGAKEAGRNDTDSFRLENYPLEKQLREYYEKEIGSYGTFIEWEARLLLHNTQTYGQAVRLYNAIFGKVPFQPEPMELEYARQIQDVRLNYRHEFLDRRLLFRAGLQAVHALIGVITPENRTVSFRYSGWNGQQNVSKTSIRNLCFLERFLEGLAYWETDEEFKKAFYLAWKLEMTCSRAADKNRFAPQALRHHSLAAQMLTPIVPYWFLKAYHMGLIPRDILFQALFDYFDFRDNLQAVTQFIKGEFKNPFNLAVFRMFFGEKMGREISGQGEAVLQKEPWLQELVQDIYDTVVPFLADTELRRGEAETVFSKDMAGITYIRGIPYLIRILQAIGKDTLDRDGYYAWSDSSGCSKRDVLSRLLKACYPADGENGQMLGRALEGTDIKKERLVEAAMYAPQWIGIIEQHLGWQGMKSGCYYFMAHMNEWFDGQKMAVIAKYTPLTAEELQDGAFDIGWFREAYGQLGEKNFAVLYQAAKYISGGQKHSRARKYADAASGKVTLEELREQIQDKRNKDLLMSYGLVPFGENREHDLMERYRFIQNYAKQAKQFGAQRRAGETKAAQTALVNLSVHAGFADVTRLVLNMEGRLAEEFVPLMDWHGVEDVEICLHVDGAGKSEVLCRKDGKMLKSVPARLKKHVYVQEIKSACKNLKEQHVRAKRLMEESMEDGAEFTAAEAAGLMGNPVVRAVLQTLVFVSGEHHGFLLTEGDSSAYGAFGKQEQKIFLKSWDNKKASLLDSQKLRIAHPLDLYRAGVWQEYQKYLFDCQMRQPFRQVFRELYVRLPEELGLDVSRVFAGNQIQPKKTAACLKGRRWIADYEEGLQKIFYKENIIAKIYALADWFSPSDIEAPTLEWVQFSDRRTFEPLPIGQVPELIYSEVMRDVDMAVSVAHAGGVDPQASHSTIEMRRAVVKFNLPLFKIQNVDLKENHALIYGTRGTYHVHLGSGTVHQEGGTMLHILPVHSQKRGKLFLPFVDEDPKTAEIMSKIVLLAEDKKIRDPFILEQIREKDSAR